MDSHQCFPQLKKKLYQKRTVDNMLQWENAKILSPNFFMQSINEKQTILDVKKIRKTCSTVELHFLLKQNVMTGIKTNRVMCPYRT